MVYSEEYIKKLVVHQLEQFWFDVDEKVIGSAISSVLQNGSWAYDLQKESNKVKTKAIQIDPYNSCQWSVFLYRIARCLYENREKYPGREYDRVYYLNKIMNCVDWGYGVDLPKHFACEHPMGTCLGKAVYGDYLFVYQGVTIGGNRNDGVLEYPVLGNNVILFSDAKVLGNSHIGNNVVISANAFLFNQNVPDNSIVAGSYPNIIIASTEEEIKSFTNHIWKWNEK